MQRATKHANIEVYTALVEKGKGLPMLNMGSDCRPPLKLGIYRGFNTIVPNEKCCALENGRAL